MIGLGVGTHDAADTRRDKRRRAILDAAQTLFLEKGYGATTLGDIVALSGGSLATLYELFGSKPGLLVAIVTERCSIVSPLIECVTHAGVEPREGLHFIACRLIEQLSDDASIALLRIVAAETPRLPEIGQLFYDAGPRTAQRTMARYLAGHAAQGTLSIDDPEEAAAMFFSMLVGDRHLRLLCGLPAGEDGARHVDRTVNTFLRLYAPA